jgi:selenocysteine lyase/cysteine desulfurase
MFLPSAGNQETCSLPPAAVVPCAQVHSKSDEGNKYLVVLDAAAHAASHVLDLSQVTPDFVTLSFYKVWDPLEAVAAAVSAYTNSSRW